MTPRLFVPAGLLVALLAVLAPAPASAAPITIGPPISSGYSGVGSLSEEPGEYSFGNFLLSDSSQNTTSPVDGTVVGWQVAGDGSYGRFKLQIIHPNGNGTFTTTATSAEALPASGPAPTSHPISAGDYIGVEATEYSALASRDSIGSKIFTFKPALGSTPRAMTYTGGDEEFGLDAFVQPAPTLTAVSQSIGPTTGGTALTIAGSYFTNATEVRFGPTSVPFSVKSDNAITATSPPGSGTVDITVRTPYGVSRQVEADKFTYAEDLASTATPIKRCVVPKLKGKSLKASRKAIRKAGCVLGKVRGRKVKGAKVKTQSAKPGTRLPAGSKVGIRLG
jgi:hypothetical protein